MPVPTIEVANLSKCFFDRQRGEIRAVDGISFRCFPGRVFGLLGPNGAGKTTTLRMLSCALKPTTGSITVVGADAASEPDRVRRSLGFLSGATGLYERLSAREILEFFGRLFGIGDTHLRGRIDELATLLHMGDFLDRGCGKLSAGQRQKVSIARTLIHDPPVIILDEPTANLDVIVAREVVQFVEAERRAGKTILYSTHIMSEVERLCDDVALVDEGRLLVSGPLAEVRGSRSMEEVFLDLHDRARGRAVGTA